MNIDAFIRSGILKNYCLGFCTAEEVSEIEMLAPKYPRIKEEIQLVRQQYEDELLQNTIKPSPSVKVAVMRAVYSQQAKIKSEFPPLLGETISKIEIEKWVLMNKIQSAEEGCEKLCITELPSTEYVTNFVVTAKQGHEEEVHEDFVEYLFVIKGTCIMTFDGKEKSYTEGEVITIWPHIKHSAIVTSMVPMLALVQRQKM